MGQTPNCPNAPSPCAPHPCLGWSGPLSVRTLQQRSRAPAGSRARALAGREPRGSCEGATRMHAGPARARPRRRAHQRIRTGGPRACGARACRSAGPQPGSPGPGARDLTVRHPWGDQGAGANGRTTFARQRCACSPCMPVVSCPQSRGLGGPSRRALRPTLPHRVQAQPTQPGSAPTNRPRCRCGCSAGTVRGA